MANRKNTGGAGEKGQLIPPEIKLPVYPASHYKKTGMNKVFLTEALLGLRRL
ncbi:hypothetical protein SEEHRA23_04405 [Salmonella enterica subsp. enterica serovar Heidelberg str. SARA33]|nr:hypothetical protein SEEHRA23_04405 [Salmonella enterica subsp. enterica serovar Heidelberg str. SARA33]